MPGECSFALAFLVGKQSAASLSNILTTRWSVHVSTWSFVGSYTMLHAVLVVPYLDRMPGGLARGYLFRFLFVELLLMHIHFLLGLKSVAIGMRHMRRERRYQAAVKMLWWAGKLLSRGGYK